MREAIVFLVLVMFFAVYGESRPSKIREVVREIPVEKVVEKRVPVEVVKKVPVEKIVVKWRIRYVDRWQYLPQYSSTNCGGY